MIKIMRNHAIMCEGIYKGIKYTVCFLRGGYFTAYLNVTNTSIQFIDYPNIDLPVYWGLTYSNSRYPWESAEDFRKWIIGWDYGHCDDAYENDLQKEIFKSDYFHESVGNIHHSVEEVKDDCIKAIDFMDKNGFITRN